MIKKATGIANFAQGDLITLGAFVGVWATDQVGLAPDGLGLSLGVGYLLTLVHHVRRRGGDRARRLRAAAGPIGARRGDRDPRGGARDPDHPRPLAGNVTAFAAEWFGAGGSLDNFLFFQDGVLRIDIEFLGIHDAVISAQRVVIIVVTAIAWWP